MKSLYEELGGTYRQVGDYLIPDIELPERNYEIGKYGRMRHSCSLFFFRLLSHCTGSCIWDYRTDCSVCWRQRPFGSVYTVLRDYPRLSA